MHEATAAEDQQKQQACAGAEGGEEGPLPPAPSQQLQQQQQPPRQLPQPKPAKDSFLKPYRPLLRFAHPFYWGNALLLLATYTPFRAQWLARAADAASASAAAGGGEAAAASAAAAAAAAASAPPPAPGTGAPIPYSRGLTRPSDLAGWERQALYTFCVIALYKTLLKRRSWDAALAHYLFYGRVLAAVVLLYADWRWLALHALACWFGYAALAQPPLDLDALASDRMAEAAAAATAAAAAPEAGPANAGAAALPSGVSLPMNPTRLRELVLIEVAEAEASALPSGSAKRNAKLLRQQQQQQQQQQQREQAGGGDGHGGQGAAADSALPPPPPPPPGSSADYWVLFVGCLSGGHHGDSVAYAPAHADLARRYAEGPGGGGPGEGERGGAGGAAAAAAAAGRRLRFAHLDASLFGAYCAASAVLALPAPHQLSWSRAVPCALLVDGRTGRALARLPTRAQAEDPLRRNMFTARDVARAFDLDGIAGGRAPALAQSAAAGDPAEGRKGGKKDL